MSVSVRGRSLRVLATLAAVCAALAAPARAATIKEIPLQLRASGDPSDILATAGGGAWVTLRYPGALVHVNAAGVQDDEYTIDQQGSSSVNVDNLAYGPDGRPWFTVSRFVSPNQITTIASAGANHQVAEHPLKTPTATVSGLATGADGNMWFTEYGAKRALARLTPDGLVTEFTGLSGDPMALAAGSDGRLWYAGGANLVGSATTAGLLTPLDLGTQLGPIVADPRAHALWLAGSAYPDYGIRRLNLDDGSHPAYSQGLSDRAIALTAAADGNVWFAERNQLGRITPSGRITEFRGPLGVYTTLHEISAGPDPIVWFLESGTVAGQVLLDPPEVAARNPSAIGTRDATLTAAVTPAGSATNVHFEYGPTPAYGAQTAPVAVGDGDEPAIVNTAIGGLAPGQTLHFRAVATSLVGTSYGPDETFTTGAEPRPAPLDADHDGYPATVDCNDRDGSVHAGARDIPGDRIDQDCNGSDAAFPRFTPRTVAKWRNFRAYSLFTTLAVEKVPAKTRVELSCRGHGCRFSHWRKTVRKTTKRLVLLRALKKSHLRHGSRLELRLIRPDAIGVLLRWRIGPPPLQVVRCLVPGKSKERKC